MTTASESKMEEMTVPINGTAKWQSPTSRHDTHVLDTTMRVTTPENIAFNYQVSGPFRRVFAYGLDLLVSIGGYAAFVIVVYLLFLFAIMPLAGMVGGTNFIQALMGMLSGLIAVGYFIVYWFYGAYLETNWNGQTIGKRVIKMRVISTDGSAIDGVQAILRNFFRLLDIMPFVPIAAIFNLEQPFPAIIPTCLFGLVIMMLTKNYQRVGDLVAGTVVITEDQKRPPNLATFMDERVPQLAELIPTSFVVPATMARAIADYVDQRKFLPFQRASEIAGHVAIPLMEKFGIQADTDHDLFLCSLYYKQFISSQAADGNEVPMSVAPAGVNTVPKNSIPATEATIATEEEVIDFPGITEHPPTTQTNAEPASPNVADSNDFKRTVEDE